MLVLSAPVTKSGVFIYDIEGNFEARFRPNIGNTLWCVSTVFTRSPITPPDVNRFGRNLGSSEQIVCRWRWQILGAIRAEARQRGETL